MTAEVLTLFRYPVKSMQGESVEVLDVNPGGIDGDRSLALLDVESGRICSAHHPLKWGALLHCRARWEDGRIVVTLPDGRQLEAGPELEEAISALTGRRVRLIREPPEAGSYEIVHPDVEGAAPSSFMERTLEAAGVRDGRVGRLNVALDAPRGALVDVAPVHVVPMPSVRALGASGGDTDLRRFRPNVVVEMEGSDYVEERLAGGTLEVGGGRLTVTIPTPRCVMTTLGQAGGVAPDTGPLRALARDNRLNLGGGGWACLGVYARTESSFQLHCGDPVRISR